MKAVCEGIDLSYAALKVVKACAQKTPLPILECIKISVRNDKMTLIATDGEISIQKTIKAEVYEDGDVCVLGKYFVDFIKKLEGMQLTLSSYNNKMEIIYGDSKTDMQVLSANDFPEIDTDIKDSSVKLKSEDLKKFISSTSFCCATDDSRPILKGCNFKVIGDDLSVTSLDGFRLGTVSGKVISSTGDIEFVCPARTLSEIEKMIPDNTEDSEIFIQKGMILVSYEDTVLTSRLYGGDFINKDNIIPKEFLSKVTVDKNALKSSIERAAIVVRGDKNCLVTLDITGDRIDITSASEIGNLKESVKCELDGKDITISMNAKFIFDALNALDEEYAELSFNSGIQPFICENREKKDKLYLILPVRTVNNA